VFKEQVYYKIITVSALIDKLIQSEELLKRLVEYYLLMLISLNEWIRNK